MSIWKVNWRRFSRNKMSVVGLVIIVAFAFFSIFANLIVDKNLVYTMNVSERLQLFSTKHLLGTDDIGRDLFARIIYGSRISFCIGIVSTLIGLTIGSFLGAACAFFGGIIDNAIMRFFDLLYSIPLILLAMLIVAVLGSNTFNLILAMTIGVMPGFAKITRGAVLSITEQEYVKAAKAAGTSSVLIILKHILPNAASILIINAVFTIASTMLAAASLSFIGLGVQPPEPEWGALLANGRDFIKSAPQLVIIPGLFITMATVGITFIGDGLRDVFDPKSAE